MTKLIALFTAAFHKLPESVQAALGEMIGYFVVVFGADLAATGGKGISLGLIVAAAAAAAKLAWQHFFGTAFVIKVVPVPAPTPEPAPAPAPAPTPAPAARKAARKPKA